MATPAALPDERVITPADGSDLDEWSAIINLDPTKDWSAVEFTIDGDATFEVDQTDKDASPPRVIVYLTPASLRAARNGFLRWNLAVDGLLNRTFLTQRLMKVDR